MARKSKLNIGDVIKAYPELVEVKIPIQFVGGPLDGERDHLHVLANRKAVALFVHPEVTDVRMEQDSRKCKICYHGGPQQLIDDVNSDA